MYNPTHNQFMAIWVVKFPSEKYKIKQIFGSKINMLQGNDCIYTAGWNVWGEWILALNHHNHKNWVPIILTHNLWLIFIGIKQRKKKIEKKNQNGRLKKTEFFKIANSQYFLWKFHGLVLGLVGLNDVKGIDVA